RTLQLRPRAERPGRARPPRAPGPGRQLFRDRQRLHHGSRDRLRLFLPAAIRDTEGEQQLHPGRVRGRLHGERYAWAESHERTRPLHHPALPRPGERRLVMRRPASYQRRDCRGVAALEVAIALPVLLFLMMATVEIGRLLAQYDALTKSVRGAARYLASNAA